MFRVKVDSLSNLISLRFSGEFDAGQGKALSALFAEQLNKLKPGFKLLTDLSKLTSMEVEAYKSIYNIMDLSNRKGVAQVVRVLANKDLDIGFNIMSLFHYSKSVEIQTCSTLKEAKTIVRRK
ncbi:MAG: hypothetical protein V1747_00225 [Candidatus Omnitrophota bacterium]